jgi:serine/threonine protein kinase
MNIVYRDLKPENLLIGSDGYLKLTDFGFAKVIEGRTYTLCGTPEYLAPEILLNKGHGKPVDWWTLGIIIYEMLAGIDPFSDEDPMAIYQKILKGKIKFPRSFDSNAKSRYFSGFDWIRLLQKNLLMKFIPSIKSPNDSSNFSHYPDSATQSPPVKRSDDPFIDW